MHMLPCADGVVPGASPHSRPNGRTDGWTTDNTVHRKQQLSIRCGLSPVLTLARPVPTEDPPPLAPSPSRTEPALLSCPEARWPAPPQPPPHPLYKKKRQHLPLDLPCSHNPASHRPGHPGPEAAVPPGQLGLRGVGLVCTAALSPGRGSQVPWARVPVVVEFLLHVHHVPRRLLEGPVRPPAQVPQGAQLGQPGPRAICRGQGGQAARLGRGFPAAGGRHSP